MKVNEEQLEKIAALAKAATAGPWRERVATGTADRLISAPSAHVGVCVIPYSYGTPESRARDSAFIRFAREDVPDLVEDLRAARTALKEIADHAGDDFNPSQNRRVVDEWSEAAGFTACRRIARAALGQCRHCGLKEGHEPWCRPEDR